MFDYTTLNFSYANVGALITRIGFWGFLIITKV